MAQQTTVRFIDDLDGSDASGTFDFSIDGRQYQIDLSDENAAKLRDALAPYVGAARKAGGRGRGRVARQTAVAEKPARSNRDQTAAIREWARAERPPGQRPRPHLRSRSSTPTRPRTDRALKCERRRVFTLSVAVNAGTASTGAVRAPARESASIRGPSGPTRCAIARPVACMGTKPEDK